MVSFGKDKWLGESKDSDVKFKPKECPYCFGLFQNPWVHKQRCIDSALYARRLHVLSLDGKTFLCQFGCRNVNETSKMSVYEHFYREHSASELKKWGINKEILGTGLSQDLRLKSIETERKIQGLKERNVFGLDPNTGADQTV